MEDEMEDDLAVILGIQDDPNRDKIIAALKPEEIAMYRKLDQIGNDWNLYATGIGPRPEGIIVCHEHKHGRRHRPTNP